MQELRRTDLLRLVGLADRLVAADSPESLTPIVLAGLAQLVDADAAAWRRIDLTGDAQELVVGWPDERFTLGLAKQVAPVLGSHPLIAMERTSRAQGHPPPRVGRVSEHIGSRRWRASPLFQDALADVDDQMVLVIKRGGPVLECVSVERQGGAFTSREEAMLSSAARQLHGAIRRTRTAPQVMLRICADPHWAVVDPRAPEPGRQPALTTRQREILALVAKGLTDAQIARRLGLTSRTVSKHLQRTYAALGVSGRISALAAIGAAAGAAPVVSGGNHSLGYSGAPVSASS